MPETQIFVRTTAGALRESVERRKDLPTYYNSATRLTPYQKACVVVKQKYPHGIKNDREIPEMVRLIAETWGIEV